MNPKEQALWSKTEVQTTEVNEDGLFNLQFPVPFPSSEVMVKFSGVSENLMLRPGDTSIIYVDLNPYLYVVSEIEIRNVNNNMTYAGTVGGFNNEYRN